MNEPTQVTSPREARAIAANRGSVALERGDFREAVRQHALVVKLVKRDRGSTTELHQALYRLGMTCRDAGRDRMATRHLKRASSLGSMRAAGALQDMKRDRS